MRHIRFATPLIAAALLFASCSAKVVNWRVLAGDQELAITSLAGKVAQTYQGEPQKGTYYYHLLRASASLLSNVEINKDADTMLMDLDLAKRLTDRVQYGLDKKEVPYVE